MIKKPSSVPTSAPNSEDEQKIEGGGAEVKINRIKSKKIRSERISGATANTAHRSRTDETINVQEKGEDVASTDKKTIQNVSPVCEGGYQNIGVLGEGLMPANIINTNPTCKGSGNMNSGIMLPGANGLFFPDNSK